MSFKYTQLQYHDCYTVFCMCQEHHCSVCVKNTTVLYVSSTPLFCMCQEHHCSVCVKNTTVLYVSRTPLFPHHNFILKRKYAEKIMSIYYYENQKTNLRSNMLVCKWLQSTGSAGLMLPRATLF